jgi:hypothetical protein
VLAFPKLVRDGRSPLRKADPDTSIDLEFWRLDPEVEGDSARKRTLTLMVLDPSGRTPPKDYSILPLEFHGIEYSLAAVEALLPTKPPVLGFGAGKFWIANKAGRLKAAGKIPAGINKTDFSRLLAAKMCEAAKTDPSIRPIMAPSIMNKLDEWGLWPISKIK